jgi:hypothetical protein
MQSTPIKQHPFCGRPFMKPAFCGLSAHIGLFELPRTSVSGHHGRTEEVLDIGATLAGSSDENIGLVSGMSARPLTALGHVSLGKATPLHSQKAFTFFFGKKTVSQVGVSTPVQHRIGALPDQLYLFCCGTKGHLLTFYGFF